MRYTKARFTHIISGISTVLLLGFAGVAQADWAELDAENSQVSYVTTKLKDISEVHFFDSMSGTIADDGKVSISIEAASVNSVLELRDDRMREFLYKVTEYTEISISAEIDLDSLAEGAQRLEFPATVSIVGAELPVNIDAFVSVTDSTVVVSSAKPVVVYAAQVGLTEGVAKLAELAGGIAIGGSVPVSFSLTFDR